MAVPKFEYFPTRAAFDTARGATTVFNNSVVFIEDTMELFTHGHFWTVSNLSQYYNSATQKLQLKNGSTVISELDASPFIKDGMLDSVELITTPESGGASSLIVEGDISGVLPIVTLDADTFEYDSNVEAHIIPVANQQNKAFSISNCGGKHFYFDGRPADLSNIAAVKLDAVASIGYNYDMPSETVNQWVAFLGGDVENFFGDNHYGFESNYPFEDGFHEGYTVTESSGSNYPTLPYLKFTFNTFSGEPTHTVIRVSIAELFTVYNGDNVLLSSNYAKAQVYAEPVAGDKVDIAVGKLAKGVADNAAAIATKQATITGAATTITTANLTASKVLGSDANGKVAATSIATTDAADAVSKRHTQNTDTKLVDNNGNEILGINHLGNLEFKRSLRSSGSANGILLNDGSLSLVNGSASIGGNLSVSGNLNVTGKETVEEIVNIKSENNFITLRDGAQTAIASGSLSGTKVENYDGLGNDLLFGTDGSGTFRIGDEGGTLEPIATRDEASNLTDGQLMKWDATNQRLVGTSDISPQINSYVASKAMTEDAYWDLVAAGTVQQNTLYITYDNDWEG